MLIQQSIVVPKFYGYSLEFFNNEAEELAAQAGMDVVVNRCMKIEHARLFGGLNFIGVDTKVISSTRSTWVS